MKLRLFAKPILAALLAAGLFGAAAAPAVSTPTAAPRHHAGDTGWGYK
jgi:hypothetical protein